MKSGSQDIYWWLAAGLPGGGGGGGRWVPQHTYLKMIPMTR